MEGAENVSALSRELKVRRKLLYEWRGAFRAGGSEALRSPGRPGKGSVVIGARAGVGRGSREAGPGGGSSVDSGAELSAARRRIAELERKVGQQALEADFFRQALQLREKGRKWGHSRGGKGDRKGDIHLFAADFRAPEATTDEKARGAMRVIMNVPILWNFRVQPELAIQICQVAVARAADGLWAMPASWGYRGSDAAGCPLHQMQINRGRSGASTSRSGHTIVWSSGDHNGPPFHRNACCRCGRIRPLEGQ
jgi:hypothetical protein